MNLIVIPNPTLEALVLERMATSLLAYSNPVQEAHDPEQMESSFEQACILLRAAERDYLIVPASGAARNELRLFY